MDHRDDPLLTRPARSFAPVDIEALQALARALAESCEQMASELFRLREDFGSGTVPTTPVGATNQPATLAVTPGPIVLTVGQEVRLGGLQPWRDVEDA